MLLAGQRDRAQDGNEDEDRGHLEGKQQVAEEHFAEVASRDDVISQPGRGQMGAGGKKDEGQQADQDATPGIPTMYAARLPWVRSSFPALSNMMTKVKSTMIAPE